MCGFREISSKFQIFPNTKNQPTQRYERKEIQKRLDIENWMEQQLKDLYECQVSYRSIYVHVCAVWLEKKNQWFIQMWVWSCDSKSLPHSERASGQTCEILFVRLIHKASLLYLYMMKLAIISHKHTGSTIQSLFIASVILILMCSHTPIQHTFL